MTLTRSLIACCLMVGGIAAAGVPVRRPLTTYQHLWDPGVMTSPAKVVVDSPLDPMANWQLSGVSEVTGGYLVTLSHRQTAGDTLIIRPSGVQVIGNSAAPAGKLTVESVDLAGGDWRKTVVHLNSDGQPAAVRFPDPLPVPAVSVKYDRPLPSPSKPAYPHKQSPAPAR